MLLNWRDGSRFGILMQMPFLILLSSFFLLAELYMEVNRKTDIIIIWLEIAVHENSVICTRSQEDSTRR